MFLSKPTSASNYSFYVYNNLQDRGITSKWSDIINASATCYVNFNDLPIGGDLVWTGDFEKTAIVTEVFIL